MEKWIPQTKTYDWRTEPDYVYDIPDGSVFVDGEPEVDLRVAIKAASISRPETELCFLLRFDDSRISLDRIHERDRVWLQGFTNAAYAIDMQAEDEACQARMSSGYRGPS